ncbi:MAG TPA: gamma-glutamyltransferase [Roseiflexaceae bacterium]|nr:gamma-glutamyltransferase [Roseiflexaceae bacterium]
MSQESPFPHRISGTRYPSRRSVVTSARGMVATSQPLAAQAGLRILLAGGNAVDAAVATAAALNVVEPMSTGIGGDVFALLYSADTAQVHALNGSGRAPAAATPDEFRRRGHKDVPLWDILAVTVPGTVDAWAQALERHGTMSLAQVLAPAIEYAERGFPVSEIIAAGWHTIAPRLRNDPAAVRTFLPSGAAPRPGQIVRLLGLAASLRLIAEGGRDAFYHGPLAEAIVATSQAKGGLLSMEDFAQHHSTWETPLRLDYRGHTVYECPPNGQGLAALLALNTVAGDDLAALGPDSPEAKHLLIEAMRLAFADAFTYIADPLHAQVPASELLSSAFARSRRALIDPHRSAEVVRYGDLPVGEDTVYLSVVDEHGNAASFINSLYYGFGSGIVAGDTGIALQNRGACFVLDESHRNCIAPGKRPYHTIIPCMVTHEGRLWGSLGVMGGFMQPQGHLQVLTNLIDFGMNPQEALDAPRFEVLTDLEQVALERSVDPALRAELAARGHRLVEGSAFGFGGGQAILIDPESGARLAGSDPRKDGCAVGY